MRMIRRSLLYFWAGATHVGTLLTIAAFFYFPVFLDTHAARAGAQRGIPWPAIGLTAFLGPALGIVSSQRIHKRWIRSFHEHLYVPIRVAFLGLCLWGIFLSWKATGRILWDAGIAWAGFFYLLYWVTAGIAAYSLSLGAGLGYFTGCAQILEYLKGSPLAKEKLPRTSLYRYSRHPFVTYMILSLWLTPLMTLDRLVWAVILSLYGLALAEWQERERERAFGLMYRDYQSQVPKWIPFLKS